MEMWEDRMAGGLEGMMGRCGGRGEGGVRSSKVGICKLWGVGRQRQRSSGRCGGRL